MRELRTWLYEIFGYVYPGLTATVAAAVLFWSLSCPTQPLVIAKPAIEVWAALAIVAYFVGHLVQALGNLVVERLQWIATSSLKQNGDLPPTVLDAVQERLRLLTGLPAPPPSDQTYALCDRLLADRGKLGDREMFVYHEGFYRGHVVACAFLGLAMLLRGIQRPQITIAAKTYILGREVPLVFGLALLGASVLCAVRYRRFMAYRISQAMLAVLVLTDQYLSDASAGEKRGDR